MAQRGRSAGPGHARAARAGAPRAAVPETPTMRPQELAALRDRLRQLVEPIVTAEELDLEELSVARAGRRYVVRITVDGESGVGHNELSDVSREISAGLDEAERTSGPLTPDAYTLEVSSPGVDRPLTLPRHWRRNTGRLVKVRAQERQLTARILAVSDTGVTLEGQPAELPFAELGPGRVQIEFTRLAELTDDELGELTDDGDEDDGTEDGDEELEDEA
jgi:ribosome maturation factor RimP